MGPELVATYELALPSGEVLILEQTLWGKVLTVHEARLRGGRYPLDEPNVTSRLRQLLEAGSLWGTWSAPPGEPLLALVRQELQDVIERLYGRQGAW